MAPHSPLTAGLAGPAGEVQAHHHCPEVPARYPVMTHLT